MNGNGADFKVPGYFSKGLVIPVGAPSIAAKGFPTQTAIVNFNNNTWIQFVSGLCVNAKDVKGNTLR